MSEKFSTLLLSWFDKNARDLPWRHIGGAHPNPYIVLVSEIMLQQTTVKTVCSYFQRFINRFDSIKTLAQADLEEVYLYWQGLGYYTRAKSLHQSAQIIMRDFGGHFPQKKEDVLKLKGLGPYSIASFMALAFNAPETVVDTNVVRIMARLYHLTSPVDEILPLVRKKAEALSDKTRSADYASAIMDLGAMICTAKKPSCNICPVQMFCLSKNLPDLEQIPLKKKSVKKNFTGYVYIISNKNNELLIRKRSEKGLLHGLYEFFWCETPLFLDATETSMCVTHSFTHIHMTLKIYHYETEKPYADGFFVAKQNLKNYAFSTLMQKVIRKIEI